MIVVSPRNWLLEVKAALEERYGKGPEAVICLSHSVQDEAWKALEAHPEARSIAYHWDCYSWTKDDWRWTHYDYPRWFELCDRSLVLVPSRSEAVRYGKPCEVVKTYIKTSQLPDIPSSNAGHVLDPVRDLPDINDRMAKRVCEKMGVPYVNPQQKMPWDEYARALASCACVVSTNREMSTGGLGIIEALWYGRPAIVWAEDTNAAQEYLGPYCGGTFSTDTALEALIAHYRGFDGQKDTREVRNWITQEYGLAAFMGRLCEKIDSFMSRPRGL